MNIWKLWMNKREWWMNIWKWWMNMREWWVNKLYYKNLFIHKDINTYINGVWETNKWMQEK